ncbi:MAG: hypothetical protein OXF02_07485 [Simkaniaceae bacterium]|nr:hypothetical protein [Simkaniaceae bacterium]
MNTNQRHIADWAIAAKLYLDAAVDCQDLALCRKAADRMEELLRSMDVLFDADGEITGRYETASQQIGMEKTTTV